MLKISKAFPAIVFASKRETNQKGGIIGYGNAKLADLLAIYTFTLVFNTNYMNYVISAHYVFSPVQNPDFPSLPIVQMQ